MRRNALPAVSALTLLGAGALIFPAAPAVAADDLPPTVTVTGTLPIGGCAPTPTPGCSMTELQLDEASGRYLGSVRGVPTAGFEASVVDRGTTYGQDGAADGAPFELRSDGTTLTFVYDPATHVLHNSVDGIVTVAGSWRMGPEDSLGTTFFAADDLRDLMTDPDGDGTYTHTKTDLPAGYHLAYVGENLSSVGHYVEGPGNPAVPFTTTEGFPVAFSWTPATREFTVTPAEPGTYDPQLDLAFWVDGDTLAFPADLPPTPDGMPRPLGVDRFELAWDDEPVVVEEAFLRPHDWDFSSAARTAPLTLGEFTPAQLAADPRLAGYVALDFHGFGDDLSGRGTPVPATWATQEVAVGRYVPASTSTEIDPPRVWQGMVGVAPDAGRHDVVATGPAPAHVTFFATESNEPVPTGTRVAVPSGAEVISGDWDGDGVDTLGWRTGNVVTLPTSIRPGGPVGVRAAAFGRVGDQLVVGDWNGDGIDTIGVRRGNTLLLIDEIRGGSADRELTFGRASDQLVVGDWDGDGVDTPAVRRGALTFVSQDLDGGEADLQFAFGVAGDVPLAGDLTGAGRDTISLRRGATFLPREQLAGGPADAEVTLGRTTDVPLLGVWSTATAGDDVRTRGQDTIAVLRR